MNQNTNTSIPAGPVFTVSQIKSIARAKLSGRWSAAVIPMFIYVVLVMAPMFISNIITLPELNPDPGSSAVMISNIFTIYGFVASGPFLIAIASMVLKIIRSEDFTTGIIWTGFSKFGQSFCTYFLSTLFSTLWAILIMLPGMIILSVGMVSNGTFFLFLGYVVMFTCLILAMIFVMRYQMSYFIASDDRNMRASEAVARSVAMMRGNLTSFFLLNFSFIGWIILASIPIGAGTSMMLSASEGGATWQYFIAFILLAAGAVAYSFVYLYMQVADAIFYSGITGNYRTDTASASEETFANEQYEIESSEIENDEAESNKVKSDEINLINEDDDIK